MVAISLIHETLGWLAKLLQTPAGKHCPVAIT